MNGKDKTSAPGAPPESSDSDFVVESHSAAFTPAPDDTTVAATSGAAAPEAGATASPPAGAAADGVAAPDDDATGEEEAGTEEAQTGAVDGDPSQTSASGASAPARDGKTGQFKKGGGRKTLSEREKELRAKVDKTTFELRDAERQLAERRKELAQAGPPKKDASTTAGTGDSATGAAGRPEGAAGVAAPKPMPVAPKYRDFATDEEYETAHSKWMADVVAWNKDQLEAVKAEIQSGIETRLKTRDEQAQQDADEQAFTSRLAAEAAKHADWQEKAQGLASVRSSWFVPEKHDHLGPTPFLSDLVRNHVEEGPQFMRFLMEDPDRAQALADLFPSRALRDALVEAPSIAKLFEHFATDAGVKEFEALRTMPPARVAIAIGALSARLAAPGGSATKPRQITNAQPPARPPVGGAGARPAASTTPKPFEDWMAEEDAKEQRERERLAGVIHASA